MLLEKKLIYFIALFQWYFLGFQKLPEMFDNYSKKKTFNTIALI